MKKQSPNRRPASAAAAATAPRGAGVAVQLRISQELAAALDREAGRLGRQRPGAAVGRTDVIREVLGRALLTSDDDTPAAPPSSPAARRSA